MDSNPASRTSHQYSALKRPKFLTEYPQLGQVTNAGLITGHRATVNKKTPKVSHSPNHNPKFSGETAYAVIYILSIEE